MWECFYLKVIPICERSILTKYFSKIFPIVLIDDWNDLDLESLHKNYDKPFVKINQFNLPFEIAVRELFFKYL